MLYILSLAVFTLECVPACKGAGRVCKDGECVCEDDFQEFTPIDVDCERG